jgi:LacI family transcriptional regulator
MAPDFDCGGQGNHISASADMLALGVLRDCRSLIIAVPGDISLVNFDDIRKVDLLDPPLTTVRHSAKEFGQRAVNLLVEPA